MSKSIKSKSLKIKILLYIGVTLLFGVYFFYISDNRWSRHRDLEQRIEKKQDDIADAKNKIENRYSYEQIMADSFLMEKYAREQLNMSKPDEVVYKVVYQ
ncbi:MAG: septum formation initiator family protein [Bacteroidales bacterium]|jgi:cell division protein FtsB|nr:septum formation initiator family protein [Bacteroidales bacterium]